MPSHLDVQLDAQPVLKRVLNGVSILWINGYLLYGVHAPIGRGGDSALAAMHKDIHLSGLNVLASGQSSIGLSPRV